MWVPPYPKKSRSAMTHESVSHVVQPAFFVVLGTDKVMLMIDELLIGLSKWIFCVYIVHKISMDSFRRPPKLP